MRLRDNFPNNTEEAKFFDVEIRDELAVFKIFEARETMVATVSEVNDFLENNGYDQINISKFIENEFCYQSSDEVVSLSLNGYIEALVLFVEREEKEVKIGINKN